MPLADRIGRHASRALVACLLALAAVARPGHAQATARVQGRVVDAATATPVANAIVEGLDGARGAVVTFLTRDDGSFAVAIPPTVATLRARRLGFAPGEAALSGTAAVRLALRALPQRLRATRVTAEAPRRCDRDAHTTEGWELATTVAEQFLRSSLVLDAVRDSIAIVDVASDIDNRGDVVPRDTIRLGLDSMFVAYRPGEVVQYADAATLARIRGTTGDRGGSGHVLRLPTVADLASDAFMDVHCFRLDAPIVEDGDTLDVLQFVPVRGMVMPDVRGTIAVTRATALPRWMDLDVVHLRPERDRYREARSSVAYEAVGPFLVVPRLAATTFVERSMRVRQSSVERRFVYPRSLRSLDPPAPSVRTP
jgi:hypothetical protein